MFVDSSAFVAILTREPDCDFYRNVLAQAKTAFTSPLVKLETAIVVSKFYRGSVEQSRDALEQLIKVTSIKIIDLDNQIGEISIDAYARFGKGQNNSAKLNIADCMHYAVAKKFGVPILCKGSDFSETDLKVLRSPD